jgi:hypothetical protein
VVGGTVWKAVSSSRSPDRRLKGDGVAFVARVLSQRRHRRPEGQAVAFEAGTPSRGRRRRLESLAVVFTAMAWVCDGGAVWRAASSSRSPDLRL